MADIVIELSRGLSPKKSMAFAPGKPAETFSVGQQGVWSVSGAGVANVHAYLFFDGTTLFVASADPTATTGVDGRKVTSDWFPLAPPCEVSLGEARFRVIGGAPAAAAGSPGGMIEENPTMAMDPMKAIAMMGPPAPGPGESTRFQPDGQPAPMGFPGVMPPPAGAPPAPFVAPGAAPSSLFAKVKADWEGATSSRRATILAIPCMIAASFLLFGEDEPETVASTKPAAVVSAPAPKTPEPAPTRAISAPQDPVPAAGQIAPASPGAAPAGEPAAGPLKQGKDKDAPKKTTQRLAADAISAGNYPEALRHYQTLVRENPNDPAFKEAVRILKARAQ